MIGVDKVTEGFSTRIMKENGYYTFEKTHEMISGFRKEGLFDMIHDATKALALENIQTGPDKS